MRPQKVIRLEPASVAGRVPPHDLDAEAAVLSAVLLSREALDRVLEVLKPEHFYADANGRIYEAALALLAEGKPIDLVEVGSWLRDRGRLAQIGGLSYIAQLSDATPAVAHVGAHAAIVYEKWRIRKLIATCQKIAAEGYGDVGVPQEFIDGAEQAVYELARTDTASTMRKVDASLREAFKEIHDAAERGDRLIGLTTGFAKLDAMTAGLHAGELTFIGARPSMGKSALAFNIAVNVADAGAGVVIFSLEMPHKSVSKRMACAEGRVDAMRARQGALQPSEWSSLTGAAALVASLPIWIDDTSSLGILELRAKVRRLQAEYNRPAAPSSPARKLGLVIVDHLHLMKLPDGVESPVEGLGKITRGLKLLAKELEVPVVVLAQLNRSVETRPTKDKRPMLSDLRGCGTIEQDADTVVFIYRDEYYNPTTTNAKGIAELIIAKQRDGATGRVLTRFSSSCTRFDNLAPGDYPELEAE